MEVKEAQRLIDEFYGKRDRARGVWKNLVWLGEEVGELFKAVREGMDAPSLGRYSLETLKVLDAGARSLERGGERVRL